MDQITIGLIGGTGLGQALGGEQGQRHEIETPFGRPSDAVIETTWAGLRILILSRHGPGHLLNPSQINSRANIFALKRLGCTHILASGAVGSLRDEFKPRDLVIPDQIIDRTTRRAASFFEKAAVHVEFAEPFDPILRQILVQTAAHQSTQDSAPGTQHPLVPDRACYVCMEGSAFSTRAESLMHRLWGGDLIGMTAMPEAKLAREAEIPYALVALVTDYDCWKPRAASTEPADQHALLKEILANLEDATRRAVDLIRRTVEQIAQQQDLLKTCPALRALELAIWSDKTRIDPQEVERLKPLWGKYLMT